MVTRACAGLLALVTTAGAPIAVDARAAPPPRVLILTGTWTEGDAPNAYQETIDLRTGFTRRVQQMGPSTQESGFNGRPWGAGNGIVTVSTLPVAIAREATLAWVDSRAWRETMALGGHTQRRLTPPGGNPVTLEFDPATRRLKRATIDADDGPSVIAFGDWRRVGPFSYPFHREQVAADGERTAIQVQSAKLAAVVGRLSLSPPSPMSHAVPLARGIASVPFEPLGASKSHILVKSFINGRPAKLIFDTGAANYLTTESVPGFGINISGGVNIGGVGESSSTGGYARVDRIAMGAAALRNETIVVGPAPWPPAKDGADGLTGFEFLAEYVTTIDYPRDRLIFATSLPKSGRGLRRPFYNDG